MLLTFPFYLTAIFTQIYTLSGTNSSIAVTSGETYVQLQWQVINGSSSYGILYGVTSNISDVRTDTVAMPTDNGTDIVHTLNDLYPGELYTIELQKDGATIFQTFAATKPLPVSAIFPQDITATSINITWSPSDGSHQDRFQVFYTEPTNLTAFLGPNVTETWYQLDGLVPGHHYQVSVRAYSHGEASNMSETVTVNTAPLAPLSVSISAIDTRRLNITWQPDTSTHQDGYQISYTYNNSAGNEVEVNTTCDPVTLTSCEVTMPGVAGQVYEVRVHSILGVAVSEGTLQVHSTRPLPVSDLHEVVGNDTAFHLTWTPPDNTSHYRQFIVEISSDYGTMQWTIRGDKSEIIVTDLHAGSRYNVTVIVSTGYEASEPVFAVVYTYPMQVTSLSNDVTKDTTTTSVAVHWTVDNSTLYNSFIVTVQPPLENLTLPIVLDTSMFTYTFTSLSPGHPYLVSVATELAGKQSRPITQAFHTLPNVPVDTNMTVVSSSEILVQWSQPIGRVEAYMLTLTPSDPELPSRVVTVTGTNHTFLGLHPGAEYSVTLVSQSGGVFSEAVTRQLTTNPSAVPTLVVTAATTDTVTVTWTEPNNTTFDEYDIRISPPDITSPITVSRVESDRSYTFSPLRPGQLYTVSVATVSQGQHSERLALNTVTQPLPVLTVAAAPVTTTQLAVTWTVNNSSQQNHFIVSYQELPNGIMSKRPAVTYNDSVASYGADIPALFPGGTYRVYVQVWQDIAGEQAASPSMSTTGTTKPKPVESLTASLSGAGTISVDWLAPTESIQDHYVVRHRPTLRDPDTPWSDSSALSTNFTITDLFAGERYVTEVYAVSHDVRSDVQVKYIVTVPIPPRSAAVVNDKTSSDSLTLEWTYNDSLTHVDHWLVSYYGVAGVAQQVLVLGLDGGGMVDTVLAGLTAGYQYNISVQSVVLDQLSSSVVLHATTKPVVNSVLSDAGSTNTSLTLGYTIEPKDYFDMIHFHIAVPNTTVTREKTASSRTVTFTGLDSGTRYTVEVTTDSGGQTSDVKTFSIYTSPNVPIVEPLPASHDITFTIWRPSGGVASYKVICTNPDGDKVKDTSIPAGAIETVVVDGLQPHTAYTCQIMSIVGTKTSMVTMEITTLQAAPSAVRSLHAVETDQREVTLSWDAPLLHNGEITLYLVNYVARKGDIHIQGGANVTYPVSTHVFTDLMAGYSYTFYVRAKTVAVGDTSQYSITTKTYKPAYKDGFTEVEAKPRTADAKLVPLKPYRLSFNFTNVFSDSNGDIIAYTVIVTQDVAAESLNQPSLPSWKMARDDRDINAYQVISNCSDFFMVGSTCDGRLGVQKRSVDAGEAEYKVFEIGSETGCENRQFCNGPLKANTVYYVTLRAYTTGQYSDTPFSEPIRTAQLPSAADEKKVGAIVAGVIAALVVLAAIIVGILFLRRRMREKSNMYRNRPDQQLSTRSPIHETLSSCVVAMSDFKEHVRIMHADSDFRYAEQFENLKEVGRNQPCTAAELPCNRGKNRFTNILPYDHSRVKLLPIDDDEGSDYMNANYIPGYSSKREYIVCQGPLHSTRDDFWRMLWEQNVRNIVMLTKCSEKGREKCDHYWPNGSEAVFYGDLQVAVLNETVFPDWIITEFRVSLGDQSRQIRHFHFTAWPDFGVPDQPQVLLRFVRTVRSKLFKESGPSIVHCSAGVGRSGTFVVLDTLLQHIKTHSTMDIYGTVVSLRKHRVWMVQTEQQYICIHKCLLCVLEGREDEHIYDNVGHSNIAFEADEGVVLT